MPTSQNKATSPQLYKHTFLNGWECKGSREKGRGGGWWWWHWIRDTAGEEWNREERKQSTTEWCTMPFVRTSLHGSAEMPKTNEGCYLKRKKTNKWFDSMNCSFINCFVIAGMISTFIFMMFWGWTSVLIKVFSMFSLKIL